jgi:hypothetical protein
MNVIDGVPVVPFYTVGNMDVECTNCGALHFEGEKTQGKSTFYSCCCHGKFPDEVQTWPDYPEELSQYFTGNHGTGKKRAFLDNIRAVNNTLAPACFCAHTYKHKTGRGPRTQRIYGQTYHTINEQVENEIQEEGKYYTKLGIIR